MTEIENKVTRNATDADPFIAAETRAGIDVHACTAGMAFAFKGAGDAKVFRYGVAYAHNSGDANGGPNGVAVVRGNTAYSGDGGASVARNASNASVGSCGVAFSQSPAPDRIGNVQGWDNSILVIAWVKDEKAYLKSVRVGDDVDCITIEPGKWYTLDTNNNYAWIAA